MRFDTLLLGFSLVIVGSVGAAEDAAASKKEMTNWQRFCNERAATYHFQPARRGKEFKRLEKPILQHTQAVREEQRGCIYLWVTEQRRPAVIGTTVIGDESWVEENTYFIVDEFHSLHDKPINGRYAEFEWQATVPGVKWQRLKDVPNSRSRKLKLLTIQARSIMKTFSAHAIDHLANNQRRPLRFQPSPIYKYEIPSADPPTTGFLFAACLGTDPEVILCLENRKTDKGNEWFCAIAWFSDMKLFVQRKGRQYQSSPESTVNSHHARSTLGNSIPEVDAEFGKTVVPDE